MGDMVARQSRSAETWTVVVAENRAAGLDLTEGVAFEALRRCVREAVAGSEVGARLEALVAELLG